MYAAYCPDCDFVFISGQARKPPKGCPRCRKPVAFVPTERGEPLNVTIEAFRDIGTCEAATEAHFLELLAAARKRHAKRVGRQRSVRIRQWVGRRKKEWGAARANDDRVGYRKKPRRTPKEMTILREDEERARQAVQANLADRKAANERLKSKLSRLRQIRRPPP